MISQRGEGERDEGGDRGRRPRARAASCRPDLLDDADEHAAGPGDRVLHLAAGARRCRAPRRAPRRRPRRACRASCRKRRGVEVEPLDPHPDLAVDELGGRRRAARPPAAGRRAARARGAAPPVEVRSSREDPSVPVRQRRARQRPQQSLHAASERTQILRCDDARSGGYPVSSPEPRDRRGRSAAATSQHPPEAPVTETLEAAVQAADGGRLPQPYRYSRPRWSSRTGAGCPGGRTSRPRTGARAQWQRSHCVKNVKQLETCSATSSTTGSTPTSSATRPSGPRCRCWCRRR